MSKHFKRAEFACKHCGKENHSNHLVSVLELVREHFKSPVIVTSGYRCQQHNANIGGAPKSKHVEGIAADIKVQGVSPIKVFDFLDDTFKDTYGIGLYDGWVHIDVRSEKARW